MIDAFTGLLVRVGFLQWWLIRRQDEHFRTTERAWILADLSWQLGQVKITTGTTKRGGLTEDVTDEHTDIVMKLTCKNEGKKSGLDRRCTRLR
jgi:hypothetical protein